jgi:hypothetical protein
LASQADCGEFLRAMADSDYRANSLLKNGAWLSRQFVRTRRMGLPKAVSLVCLYSAQRRFRAATMRRCACSLNILRLGIFI